MSSTSYLPDSQKNKRYAFKAIDGKTYIGTLVASIEGSKGVLWIFEFSGPNAKNGTILKDRVTGETSDPASPFGPSHDDTPHGGIGSNAIQQPPVSSWPPA